MGEQFDADMELLDGYAKNLARKETGEMPDGYEPSPNDFEDEIEFKTLDGVQRTADRYIWFPGQLMEPRLLRSRPEFALLGGEYFGSDYPALALSKYTLFRARITPVTLRPRPLPVDEKIVNKEIETFSGVVITKGELAPARVQYVKTFPGDQLETIVFGGRAGDGKGYTEITALQEMEYSYQPEKGKFPNKQILNEIQLKIFPDWMDILRGAKRLPATLRGLIELIIVAKEKYGNDSVIDSITDEMLASCDQFRLWGIGRLQMEGTQIRAGVNPNGGYVHHYTPVAELLLAQLEMKRENLLEDNSQNNNSMEKFAEAAASMAETAKANAATAEANNKFLQTIIQNRGVIGEQLDPPAAAEAFTAENLNATATGAEKPITAAKVTETKKK